MGMATWNKIAIRAASRESSRKKWGGQFPFPSLGEGGSPFLLEWELLQEQLLVITSKLTSQNYKDFK
jgi:hypothetical protein